MRATLLIVAALALLQGCVHSYAGKEAMTFEQFPYTSLDGTEWPQKKAELPKAGEKYKLGAQNHVTYVELNPEGKQTIVFLHGLGSYLKFWRYQLNFFASQGYRVLAFDQLGYGKSDKPGEFPYTIEAFSEVVAEFLDVTNTSKAIVIGHSMGGAEAMSTAIRFPEKVEAVVLTSPAGLEPFSPREKGWFKRAMSVQFIKSGTEYGAWGSIRYNNFSRWRPELEWLIEERVRVIKTPGFDPYAYAQVKSVEGLTHNDFIRDSLAQIKAPTFIAFGEADKLIPNPFLHGGTPRKWMTWGHEQIPGSKLQGFAGCGHTLQMDCPDDYNAAVLGFLKSLP